MNKRISIPRKENRLKFCLRCGYVYVIFEGTNGRCKSCGEKLFDLKQFGKDLSSFERARGLK